MELFLDCLPCMLRQVLEAACMATDDEAAQEHIMKEALRTLSGFEGYSSAPALCEAMHEIVKKHTGVEDPYAHVKARDISEALRLEPLMRRFAKSTPDQLMLSLKVSATGNVMDSALYSNLDIKACLMSELEKPFSVFELERFEKDLENAGQILIIGDNAGEAVFDKILIQQLSRGHEIIYAVRDKPIINDVTAEDAREAGVESCATIISTGCGAPGAILESCSETFRALFDSADLVISKGQGNFEALSEAPRKVYFLLKAKCPKIAKALGVQVNEYVFKTNDAF